MKNLFMFLVFIGMLSPLRSQETNSFTFPELDGKLASLWSSAESSMIDTIRSEYDAVEVSWQSTIDDLKNSSLTHLDMSLFIDEQGAILKAMKLAIDRRDYSLVAQQCYTMLNSFREARVNYTNDLYSLDELVSAFSIYDQLHYAVDDPMLGLYDWQDFEQLFVDFRKQFNRYVVIAKPDFRDLGSLPFDLAVERVHECSREFAIALEGAQQGDFVAPCDDTRDALMDLIALYAEKPTTSQ